MRRGVVAVLALGLCSRAAAGQTAPGPPVRYTASWWDVGWVGAAGALYVLPGALGLPSGAPSCAPCDPATLPGVDRWAVRPVSNGADVASDVVLAGVAGWTAWAGLGGLSQNEWRGNFATFADAASWTAASTEWLKVLVRRKRPVLYTNAAAAAASTVDNQESFPSLHTSLAFAAATSYLVVSGREGLPHRARNALMLYAAALAVSALRVASAQHFPTDVLAGAALGSGVGWLVPTIHPTTP
jgi:hypothetical protein